jgi:hypothetical protein
MQHHPALPARDSRSEVVYQPIEPLKPDPRNPRRHEHKQIRQIAASIVAFGFKVPILVDAQLKVIAAHGRLPACPAPRPRRGADHQPRHLNEAMRLVGAAENTGAICRGGSEGPSDRLTTEAGAAP